MARPTKYKPEFAEQAKHLCQLGATDRDVAEFLGVAEYTVRRWSARYPEFCAALKVGKAEADARVEQSLYRRATGYTHEEEKVFCNADGKVTRVKTLKHYPPDTTACIFWLKNRNPAEWRDRMDFGGDGESAAVSSEPMSTDEWEQQYATH